MEEQSLFLYIHVSHGWWTDSTDTGRGPSIDDSSIAGSDGWAGGDHILSTHLRKISWQIHRLLEGWWTGLKKTRLNRHSLEG